MGIEVNSDPTILISVADKVSSTNWIRTETVWSKFINQLSVSKDTGETHAEFMALSKSDQTRIKDVGGFVGGVFNGQKRSKQSVESRSLITLDADNVSIGVNEFTRRINLYVKSSYVIYSTHKHTPQHPRLRIIFPLSRSVPPVQFEAISRKLALKIGIQFFDSSTHEPNRLFFWPSHSRDGKPFFSFRDGLPIEPETFLEQNYTDWTDISEWPRSNKEVANINQMVNKQKDPRTKRGLIGTFCKNYTIPDVIDKFLPDIYEPFGNRNDRYTYTPGSASGGLVVYDNGLFCYGHDDTDPAGGRLSNAFDLFRIHLYAPSDNHPPGGNDSRRGEKEALKAIAKDPLISKVQSSDDLHPIQAENEGDLLDNTGDVVLVEGTGKSAVIPKPFKVNKGSLFEEKEDKKSGAIQVLLVSRKVPFITKEFKNVERPQVFYELYWKDHNRSVEQVVPASTISTRKALLELSDNGLSVNENNVKRMISFFDKFQFYNDIDQCYAVDRLGSIKKGFVHPAFNDGVKILAIDEGEKQLLEGFEMSGTSESWSREVFERIKDQPKAVFMVLASFASVIIKDLHVHPFIVDLSGSTSQGKTTTLKVAGSVWGNNNLINEWNATRVSIERKASYLNSYPLLMDDTRKADERVLKQVIYDFSGGRSKGRGSVKGSQREYTWANIMLSTGEVSLNEYAKNQGGAAARIIPLVDEPLKKDYENITNLYAAIENNFGTIGFDFLNIWLNCKKELVPEYTKLKKYYTNKSIGNEVLTRLAEYYASVHFTGTILKNRLGLNVDLESISQLFDDIAYENKAIDKPMQMLEEILTDLDNKRDSIEYGMGYRPPIEVKAIYKEGMNQLFLTPAYTKDFLGVEEKQIRREWLKRGITVPNYAANGEKRDYMLISQQGNKYRAIAINREVISDLGFEFRYRDPTFNDNDHMNNQKQYSTQGV